MKKEEFKLNEEQFFEAIDAMAKQSLLEKDEIIEIIRESIIKSFHSKFDPGAELELILDPEAKKIELINKSKYVVDGEVEDQYRAVEVPLNVAKKINPEAKAGDTIAESVEFAAYSKQIAPQIRQLIIQNVREKNKKAIYAKHKSLKGEMISAVVTSSSPTHAILQLDDGTIAFMPSKLKNPKIKLSIGERTDVYVEDVLEDAKEAQIIVSNGSKTIVKRILEEEVPEIMEGIIEIVSLARIPGFRTKVAVRTSNENIDPVGAIIGASGSRIKAIISRLDGEKLDIIEYNSIKDKYIANSLSPAKVIAIVDKKDEEGNVIEGHKIAITPNKHQTLAIGKQGTNVRLAVELVQTRIDVISIDEARSEGIEFTWNGNVTEEEVKNIEAGIKQTRESKPKNWGRKNNSFSMNSFDSDIESFNEEMGSFDLEESNDPVNLDSFEVNNMPMIKEDEEEIFTQEELDSFEDFDFDEAEIDEDFL